MKVLGFLQIRDIVIPEERGNIIYGFLPAITDKSEDLFGDLYYHITETYCSDSLNITTLIVEPNGMFFYEKYPENYDEVILENKGYCNVTVKNKICYINYFCAISGNGRKCFDTLTQGVLKNDEIQEYKLESVFSVIGFYRKLGFKFANELEEDTLYFNRIWSDEKMIKLLNEYVKKRHKEKMIFEIKHVAKVFYSRLKKYVKKLQDSYYKDELERIIRELKTEDHLSFEYIEKLNEFKSILEDYWIDFFNDHDRFDIKTFTEKTLNAGQSSDFELLDMVKSTKNEPINQCILCESQAKFRCEDCVNIAYCSEECAQEFWNNGHKEFCRKEN